MVEKRQSGMDITLELREQSIRVLGELLKAAITPKGKPGHLCGPECKCWDKENECN